MSGNAATASLSAKHAGKLRDPALFLSVAVIWVFLAVFILFPLVKILILTFEKDGQPSLAALLEILSRKSHYTAFWNSLLLGGLVGVAGTVLGFFFRLHGRPRQPAEALDRLSGPGHHPAVDFTALHHGHRDDLFLRPPGAHHL